MALSTSEAAAAMGRVKSERKTEAGRINSAKARARLNDPDVVKTMSEKQQARRQREREEKARLDAVQQLVLPETVASEPKRGPGRPRKQTVEETGEKRGKGRPPGSRNKPKEPANV